MRRAEGRGILEQRAPGPGVEGRQRAAHGDSGGVGEYRPVRAEPDRAPIEPGSAGAVGDETEHGARKAAVADVGDPLRTGPEAALDPEPAFRPARLAEGRGEVERDVREVGGEAPLPEALGAVAGGREVDGHVPGCAALQPRQERGVFGKRPIDDSGVVEVCGQQAPGAAAVDRQARHVRRLRRGSEDGVDRLSEQGRGDAVGFDAAVAECDHAARRLDPPFVSAYVDPVPVEGDLSVDGGRSRIPERKREPEIDRALAVRREVFEHVGELPPQRALGEVAHRVGAPTRDASRDLHHRRLGVDVFDDGPKLPQRRSEDLSGVGARLDPRAVEA